MGEVTERPPQTVKKLVEPAERGPQAVRDMRPSPTTRFWLIAGSLILSDILILLVGGLILLSEGGQLVSIVTILLLSVAVVSSAILGSGNLALLWNTLPPGKVSVCLRWGLTGGLAVCAGFWCMGVVALLSDIEHAGLVWLFSWIAASVALLMVVPSGVVWLKLRRKATQVHDPCRPSLPVSPPSPLGVSRTMNDPDISSASREGVAEGGRRVVVSLATRCWLIAGTVAGFGAVFYIGMGSAVVAFGETPWFTLAFVVLIAVAGVSAALVVAANVALARGARPDSASALLNWGLSGSLVVIAGLAFAGLAVLVLDDNDITLSLVFSWGAATMVGALAMSGGTTFVDLPIDHTSAPSEFAPSPHGRFRIRWEAGQAGAASPNWASAVKGRFVMSLSLVCWVRAIAIAIVGVPIIGSAGVIVIVRSDRGWPTVAFGAILVVAVASALAQTAANVGLAKAGPPQRAGVLVKWGCAGYFVATVGFLLVAIAQGLQVDSTFSPIFISSGFSMLCASLCFVGMSSWWGATQGRRLAEIRESN
ncbi:MAG: hypothetical protein ACRCYX_14350 [Dermatophilaceae bacterium]